MGTNRWVLFTLALALVFGGGGALAEVYRWKDSNGQVHFGDRPHTTDPKVVKEVAVPPPNMAQGFKGAPPSTTSSPTTAVETTGPTRPVVARPEPAPQRGVAAQSKDSCQAQKAAYQASVRCFGSCGRTNNGMSRNNAGCEHCVEQPRPHC